MYEKIAVIQSSLRENSNTSIVCNAFIEKAQKSGMNIEYIDLRKLNLEFCDGRDLIEYNVDLNNAYKILDGCDVIVFGMPVYQYTMSGVLKNFIDICGGSMKGKDIGIMVNSGGPNCYMASKDLFDALYYEYGTKNIYPTVFTWSMDFDNSQIKNQKVIEKIDEFVKKLGLFKKSDLFLKTWCNENILNYSPCVFSRFLRRTFCY